MNSITEPPLTCRQPPSPAPTPRRLPPTTTAALRRRPPRCPGRLRPTSGRLVRPHRLTPSTLDSDDTDHCVFAVSPLSYRSRLCIKCAVCRTVGQAALRKVLPSAHGSGTPPGAYPNTLRSVHSAPSQPPRNVDCTAALALPRATRMIRSTRLSAATIGGSVRTLVLDSIIRPTCQRAPTNLPGNWSTPPLPAELQLGTRARTHSLQPPSAAGVPLSLRSTLLRGPRDRPRHGRAQPQSSLLGARCHDMTTFVRATNRYTGAIAASVVETRWCQHINDPIESGGAY